MSIGPVHVEYQRVCAAAIPTGEEVPKGGPVRRDFLDSRSRAIALFPSRLPVENIEVNKKITVGYPEKVRALKILEWRLRRAVDDEHLKRHVGLCRTFLKEPEHCGN